MIQANWECKPLANLKALQVVPQVKTRSTGDILSNRDETTGIRIISKLRSTNLLLGKPHLEGSGRCDGCIWVSANNDSCKLIVWVATLTGRPGFLELNLPKRSSDLIIE